jgi:predicted dehydrogenase
MVRNGLAAGVFVLILLSGACTPSGKKRFAGAGGEVKLVVIDPGHFHAALVQKSMYAAISPEVHVYAPEGPDADDYLARVEGFNTRKTDPTRWREVLYRGPDFLEAMAREKAGNVAVIAGNNKKKTETIQAAVQAGMNVLADKPMCIDSDGFEKLKRVFITAEGKGLLIKDMMTERFEIASILQKALANDPEGFGVFETGTPDDPAVTKESVHHFSKLVAGVPIVRPPWFFDVKQQGEGLADVTTHLVDLIQWGCFPDEILRYQTDIKMLKAKRWPTLLTKRQFEKVTGLKEIPDYLQSCINSDGMLGVTSNGEMVYRIKGIHAKVSVAWKFEAPPGGGDTHFSIMRGTKARIIIRQGKEQNFKTELFVEPSKGSDLKALAESLADAVLRLNRTHPGLVLEGKNGIWHVRIPDAYRVGHEAHFAQVTESFLDGLLKGKLPEWEVPNMIAKYYTTTAALELARDAR